MKSTSDMVFYEEFKRNPGKLWKALTGVEIICKFCTEEELDKSWVNWQGMSMPDKIRSNKQSRIFYGMTMKSITFI